MNWDNYFLNVCNAVSSKSHCLSRQVGVIIVRDHSIVSTGYNGPARGYPHCNDGQCPRHAKGLRSGEGLSECPAAHAEVNAISNAARLGTCIRGCTMYMNTREIACKDCMTAIVNSGIVELVTLELVPYSTMSFEIARYGKVKLRTFNIQKHYI